MFCDVAEVVRSYHKHARIQRGGGGGGQGVRSHLKNHKNIGFLSNIGPDPLKITKLRSQNSIGSATIRCTFCNNSLLYAPVIKKIV